MTDGRGNTSTTEFDDDHGQITSSFVPAPFNWETKVAYDQWRRPINQTDINGRESFTFYDEYSRVTEVRTPRDANENADTVRYNYNQDVFPARVQSFT